MSNRLWQECFRGQIQAFLKNGSNLLSKQFSSAHGQIIIKSTYFSFKVKIPYVTIY